MLSVAWVSMVSVDDAFNSFNVKTLSTCKQQSIQYNEWCGVRVVLNLMIFYHYSLLLRSTIYSIKYHVSPMLHYKNTRTSARVLKRTNSPSRHCVLIWYAELNYVFMNKYKDQRLSRKQLEEIIDNLTDYESGAETE
ncbi:hypothetical protein NQ318_019491 [Aromia moschata]|uniref:Uncharacterized protein n=1 Tax=Aromia moschata TaxID=1265417 RepID=A0AAV8XD68_9CUCU|nr:hypothetical protein NQ318_019491 [Aromia moschata]